MVFPCYARNINHIRIKGTLSGEATLSFTYLLPWSRGVYYQRKEGFTIKGKNLLFLEQILSFESKPLLGRAMAAREANRKSQKLFPLVKMAKKKHGTIKNKKKMKNIDPDDAAPNEPIFRLQSIRLSRRSSWKPFTS